MVDRIDGRDVNPGTPYLFPRPAVGMRVFGLASRPARSQYAMQAPLQLGQETFTVQWPPRPFVELQLLDAKGLHRLREELVPIAGKLQQRPRVSQRVQVRLIILGAEQRPLAAIVPLGHIMCKTGSDYSRQPRHGHKITAPNSRVREMRMVPPDY